MTKLLLLHSVYLWDIECKGRYKRNDDITVTAGGCVYHNFYMLPLASPLHLPTPLPSSLTNHPISFSKISREVFQYYSIDLIKPFIVFSRLRAFISMTAPSLCPICFKTRRTQPVPETSVIAVGQHRVDPQRQQQQFLVHTRTQQRDGTSLQLKPDGRAGIYRAACASTLKEKINRRFMTPVGQLQRGRLTTG
ncbi:uncharacterized protein H6S33_006709 [Morchella sextelata]|uniref:uncharacterized protein n=1 Tax=Morchella sextelata TaxID=1174677 RepID=UPI001D044B36|nr:uncharacterized protein H6S33_006709 [Morchella sextelata]KAH0604332.1 hypothetical protein H6S33_006709 [Morchella sextelata]